MCFVEIIIVCFKECYFNLKNGMIICMYLGMNR